MTHATVSDIHPVLQPTDSHDVERILDQAAATMANPAYGNRLRLAKELVRIGAVTLHDDGTATVVSKDHTYDITQACTCEDSRLRSPYCKHVLAAQLLGRISRHHRHRQNESGDLDQPSDIPPPATSRMWAVNEAAASCCLKFKIDGIDVIYTMRDVDDSALFPRVKQILARLQGRIGQTEADRGEPSTPDGTLARPQGWCQRHDVQMTPFSNETGCWWAHQLEDGTWCKGK